MIKKYFIFSDVHSYYDKLMAALKEKGFDINNPDHYIISCGDLCDRGDKPKECLNFANKMYAEGRAILIRGNHEDLMEEAIARREFWSHDIHNCTDETVHALVDTLEEYHNDYEALRLMSTNEIWNTYINATVDYAEIGDNIFVHGWIPTKLETIKDDQYEGLPETWWPTKEVYNLDWRNCTWSDDWKEARWLNGMKMWSEGIREPGKTIWCGHYHASWGNSNLHNDGVEFLNRVETYHIDPETGKQEPHVNHNSFKDDGIVCLDACTALSGQVNVEILEINS